MLFLIWLCFASCQTAKRIQKEPSQANAEKPLTEAERKELYAKIVKGTDLDPNYSPSAALQTDTQHYPFYIATAGYAMSVYNTPVNPHSVYCLKPYNEFIFEDTIGPCYHIKCGDFTGYVLKNTVGKRKGYTQEQIESLVFDKETGTYTKEERDNARRLMNNANSSQVGSNVSSSTANKTVHVNGYYRSNGTYVQSYDRSPPHRH